MKLLLVAVAIAASNATCRTTSEPVAPVVETDPVADGGPIDRVCFVGAPDAGPIAEACSNLCSACVEIARPTAKGAKCVAFLGTAAQVQSNGWLTCLAKATSCVEANACK